VAAVEAAPFVVEVRRQNPQEAGWGAAVNLLLPVLALFLVVAPFIVEFLLGRSRQPLPSGMDVSQLLLLTGVGGSSAVSFVGLLRVFFGHGTTTEVYGWAAVSVAGMVFYAWRFRRALT
jgi:hypothetical protein